MHSFVTHKTIPNSLGDSIKKEVISCRLWGYLKNQITIGITEISIGFVNKEPLKSFKNLMNTGTALMNKKERFQFFQKCHYEHKTQRNAFF